jgi:hypothetical protein
LQTKEDIGNDYGGDAMQLLKVQVSTPARWFCSDSQRLESPLPTDNLKDAWERSAL